MKELQKLTGEKLLALLETVVPFLPTTDPLVEGKLWLNVGVLTVSDGPIV